MNKSFSYHISHIIKDCDMNSIIKEIRREQQWQAKKDFDDFVKNKCKKTRKPS